MSTLHVNDNCKRESTSLCTSLLPYQKNSQSFLSGKDSMRVELRHVAFPIQQKQVREATCCSKERFLKALATIGGIAATLPFCPVAFKVQVPAREYTKYVMAVLDVMGFAKLQCFAGYSAIDDLLKGSTHVRSKKLTIWIWSSSELVAIAAQFPVAIALKDSSPKGLGILSAGVYMFGGSLFAVKSVHDSIENLFFNSQLHQKFRKKQLNEFEKVASKIKNCVLHSIRNNRKCFRNSKHEKQLELINSLSKITSEEAYLQQMLSLDSDLSSLESRNRCITWMEMGVQGFGWGLTAIYIYFLGKLAFDGAKETIDDNDYVGWFFGIVSGGANYYLTQSMVSDVTLHAFRYCTNWILGKGEHNPHRRMRPKITLVLELMGMIIDLGAAAPMGVIAQHTYRHEKKEVRLTLQAAVCGTIFLLLFSSTLSIIDELIKKIIQEGGTDNEKEVLALSQKYDQLLSLFDKQSFKDFVKAFARFFPEEYRDRIGQHCDVKMSQLAALFPEREKSLLLQQGVNDRAGSCSHEDDQKSISGVKDTLSSEQDIDAVNTV